jgi:hypothetical protein
MLCCLVGAALLAVLVRVAQAGRRRAGPFAGLLALVVGVAAGMFLLELMVSGLTLTGLVRATSPLPARLAFVAVPAVLAVVSLAAGGGGQLGNRRDVALLTLTATGGALMAEVLDLHLLHLHEPQGLVGNATAHLAVLGIFAGGLLALRSAPPEPETDTHAVCHRVAPHR